MHGRPSVSNVVVLQRRLPLFRSGSNAMVSYLLADSLPTRTHLAPPKYGSIPPLTDRALISHFKHQNPGYSRQATVSVG